MLEATRIRQEGYSWRPGFAEFVSRYKILGFPVHKLDLVQENLTACKKIIAAAKLENYHIGKTKLFLKYYHVSELEKKLRKFFGDVVRTQAVVRAFFARRRFRKLLERARLVTLCFVISMKILKQKKIKEKRKTKTE